MIAVINVALSALALAIAFVIGVAGGWFWGAVRTEGRILEAVAKERAD